MVSCGQIIKWRLAENNLFAILFMHGNIEHLIIQYDFLSQVILLPRHEYVIPNSKGGFFSADLCSMARRQLWEIKPERLAELAVTEAALYAKAAKLSCGPGWTPGTEYQAAGKWLVGYRRKDCVFSFRCRGVRYDLLSIQKREEPGAVCYHWESNRRKLKTQEITVEFREAVYNALLSTMFAAPDKEIVDPLAEPLRPIGPPIRINRPTITDELTKLAKELGRTVGDIPSVGYLLPNLVEPKIAEIYTPFLPIKDAIQQFMSNVVIGGLFEGEQVIVMVEDLIIDRIEGERAVRAYERATRVAAQPSPFDFLTVLIARFEKWWNGLSENERTFVILATIVVAVGVVVATGGVGGVAILSAEEALLAGATVTTARAVASGSLVGVAGSVGLLTVGIKEANAATPPKTNPIVKDIGNSVNANLSRYSAIPLNTKIPLIALPKADGKTVETFIPRFFIANKAVHVGDVRPVDGIHHQVIAISQKAKL